MGEGDEPPDRASRDVDAGLKALAFDSGPPLESVATYEHASDEHGRLGTMGTTNCLGLDD